MTEIISSDLLRAVEFKMSGNICRHTRYIGEVGAGHHWGLGCGLTLFRVGSERYGIGRGHFRPPPLISQEPRVIATNGKRSLIVR